MRLLPVVLVLAACQGRVTDELEDTGEPVVVEGCRAGPGPAERIVVVSHPYAVDDTEWEVLSLSASGELATTGQTFSLGRATEGVVAFTPDGSLGLAAIEDGQLGVFSVVDGQVTVEFSGEFSDLYVTSVAMHPSGEKALLLDVNWRKNGGAVVEVAIDCDTGALTETRRWASKLAYAASARGADQWVVAADDIGSSGAGDVHLLGDDAVATASVFPDQDAVVSTMALAGDLALIGDFSGFGGGNRVGVARLDGDQLVAEPLVANIEDPVGIGVAPDRTSALISSGFGDALFAVAIDPSASPPVSLLGELIYDGGRPALPSGVVTISELDMAFVAENVGVRRVAFAPGGEMTDLGRFELGSGVEVVVGGIGVQP
ncbi:MAG: hypothetical protein EP330_21085 [Deltaproteobacteria bacterium]|nr:MAG: hypothetical protein EP330_21085 [Deltaproteobacteria bacterium]